jgi:hypothetical protein
MIKEKANLPGTPRQEGNISLTIFIVLLMGYLRPLEPGTARQNDTPSSPTDLCWRSPDSLNRLYPKGSKTRQYCTDFCANLRNTVMTKDRQIAD